MAENGLIAAIAISILINVFVIAFMFATGIGQDCWRRFRNKQKHKKGGYVNSLMVSKDGVVNEVFKKVDSYGKFNYKGKSYVRTPRMRTNFRGIPTFIHKEDTPSPVDVFEIDDGGMSCGELDDVMNSQTNFDFRLWLQSMLPFVLIGAAILVGAIGLLAYYDYMTFQMLRDGTFKAVQIAAAPITGSV